jgi:hypothetical protein
MQSQTNQVHTTNSISKKSILMLSIHLCLGLPRGSFPLLPKKYRKKCMFYICHSPPKPCNLPSNWMICRISVTRVSSPAICFWKLQKLGMNYNLRHIEIVTYSCKKANSVALSPRANYTDWATATWRNLVPISGARGVSRGQCGGSLTVVNLSIQL